MTKRSAPDLLKILKDILRRHLKPLAFFLIALRNCLLKSRVPHLTFKSENFDTEYYLQKNPDVKASGLSPHTHYLTYGYLEGRQARIFDDFWYANKYRTKGATIKNAARHYQEFGKAQGFQARYILLKTEHIFSERNDYTKWLKAYGKSLQHPLPAQQKAGPRISILMAVYNTDIATLKAAIDSVIMQTYPHWELCICDDASTASDVLPLLQDYASKDERIKLILREQNGHISRATNSALTLATGDYIGLLDHDDLLSKDALQFVAEAIAANPDVDIIYSDEDKIDSYGVRQTPYFKPDFNYELFLAQNMISHFGVYRSALVRKIGGFREGLEGAQDYDLALRVLEQSDPSRVYHIPRILYHWRAIEGSTALSLDEKSYAVDAGLRAVNEHLTRLGVKANVTLAAAPSGHYRVRYELPRPSPLISLIIPTRDRLDVLELCISSILERSTYKNIEIIIVDNGSVEPETHAYFASLPTSTVKILRDDTPFNFSALNNRGVKLAQGEYVCLVNNDIEILTPDWLEELLSFAQRPDVGCVGARLWYPDKTLQHGGIILGIGGVAGHAHKCLEEDETGYFCRAIHHQSYSAVTAACLMVRKSTYEAVGGFSEELAVAFNDVDFCLRVRAAGYRNVWTPYAEMIHHESASRGSEITPAQQKRFSQEVAYMHTHWGDALFSDPAYNPNLTLDHEDYSLAWPPRTSPFHTTTNIGTHDG
ncbi:glycosyltransferase family 2 protein [Asticcacaulis taihuensis]|uniref:glycosyltransferase family 2 protein n=1 Tax=Asticcacaulis taihuensis TaxID=260084 RepID=UPI003F7CC2A0